MCQAHFRIDDLGPPAVSACRSMEVHASIPDYVHRYLKGWGVEVENRFKIGQWIERRWRATDINTGYGVSPICPFARRDR